MLLSTAIKLLDSYFGHAKSVRWAQLLVRCIPSKSSYESEYLECLIRWSINDKVCLPGDFKRIFKLLHRWERLAYREFHPHLADKELSQMETPQALQYIMKEAARSGVTEDYSELEFVGEYEQYRLYKIDHWIAEFPRGQEYFKYALGTSWCIKNRETFDSYSLPFYLITRTTGERVALLHPESCEIRNTKNRILSNEELKEIIPLVRLVYKSNPLCGDFLGKEDIFPFDPSQFAWENCFNRFRMELILKIIRTPIPQLEPIILLVPEFCLLYSSMCLKKRWPEGEKQILKSPDLSYEYAFSVIKGRWPEAEKTIINSPKTACKYAANIIQGRWLEAETTIARNPESALIYAQTILKSRFLEAENYLPQNPRRAIEYAIAFRPGPWPELEKKIRKMPELAFDYLESCRKKRWPEAEPSFRSRMVLALDYAKKYLTPHERLQFLEKDKIQKAIWKVFLKDETGEIFESGKPIA